MNRINYDKAMLGIVAELSGRHRLLLHSCCGPCSTYCVEETSKYFDVTVYYFNPNIDSEEEYGRRLAEQRRLLDEFEPNGVKIDLVGEKYTPEEYYAAISGMENEPEGGKRCESCFELRLRKAAEYARAHGYDFFTTTLTVSPLKNAEVINGIGERIGREYGVKFLPTDFKKREGYKRSVELSARYGLYRQSYCGCKYSKEAAEKK